ncbi:imidazolonepropionase [Vibrio neptunius]|uniref:Imidazolonepropionase n=1 Tax=Vibrio neptunius TaxID=170651 RepID=A0ABS3A636_9VIBR|nr:imidazolonepropionase [Vibrio neptunius]MBN3494673.1 imidazolonepropionase [Vibrio neptunius]MBN3517091.1 imidazolonepropionase [Vibrio neptunius]MBN3551452.1 imidazolonepropionase [Vibrio neptunius]MBN3579485.1 imidazolonepropionase [Vibrio neptunius]MCH9873149.1 imidazolonepropionase [Vibrio neptunius]
MLGSASSSLQTNRRELLLTNARLVSMVAGSQGYSVSEPSHLLIRDGKIAHIGATKLSCLNSYDCKNQLVTPGFVDCHTHLVYAGNRSNEFEMRLNGVPYPEIAKQGGGILSTVRATRAASEEALINLALPRLDGLIRSGVTSVEVKSGYGLTLKDEIKMLRAAKALEDHRKIRVTTTLLAAHALPPEYAGKADDYIKLVCEEIIPLVAEEKLATSVDVFCESIGFNLAQTEKVFAAAKQYGLDVKGHTEQLSNLGGTALTARYQGLSADHIEYLDQDGVKALAESGTVATLLPGAFYFLRETQMPPIELLRQHNIPIAIATDLNPGTSPFSDLTMMMNMGCTLFGLTPEETLRGVTCHAAQALGYGSSRGQIQPGFDADLAIWDVSHPADFSYQQGLSRLSARIVNGELEHV